MEITEDGNHILEEPSVRIELLLILLLEAKQDLNGNAAGGDFATIGNHNIGGVLEDVRGDVLGADSVLCNAFNIASHLSCALDAILQSWVRLDAYQGEDFQGARVDLGATV